MRKIEFRGKTVHTNKWVYGGIAIESTFDKWYIIEGLEFQQVHKESVGQLIEHQFWNEEDTEVDKSREYIYEGDILLTCARCDVDDYDWDHNSKPDFLKPYRVAIKGTEAVLLDKKGEVVEQWSDGEIDSNGLHLSGCGYEEVIGNYFDNPELMGDK